MNNLILEFNDKFVNDNYFIRTIKDTQSHIINNKLVTQIRKKQNIKFIDKVKLDSVINQNIITLDL